ncbi:MAG: YbaB/EbfC family nucleoid-associated protein [Alphaproteobacteria bacterium]|nr:YbaB/EbfC family nucleoid-associated protein [Alphaproteobacteria bacterium]
MFKNMQGLMQQAQKMQQKMAEAQEKLAATEIVGNSGAGMVEVTMNGKFDVRKIKIDPKIVDPNDIEMLEDLITAAINDARTKVEALSANEMGKVTEGMPLPPGFKL